MKLLDKGKLIFVYIFIGIYRQGPKNTIVQHWNFAGPIFQANQALIERLVQESALVSPVPD